MKLKWSIWKWPVMATVALALVGYSVVAATSAPKPQPNIRQLFLHYVPPNEPGAPHDLEYLFEHAVGDGGYYGTKYFPGVLTVSQYTGKYIQHYRTKSWIITNPNGTSRTETKRIPTTREYAWNGEVWIIRWTIRGTAYDFGFYRTASAQSAHVWKVVHLNSSLFSP